MKGKTTLNANNVYYTTVNNIRMTHSKLMKDVEGDCEYITVRYERLHFNGFDSMEMQLPRCNIIYNFGFSEEDVFELIEYAKSNYALIWQAARVDAKGRNATISSKNNLYYSTVDNIILTHSRVMEDLGGCGEYIIVRYERPNSKGFDSMEMQLPRCNIIRNFGFSEDDVFELIEYAQLNSALIWEFAREGLNERATISHQDYLYYSTVENITLTHSRVMKDVDGDGEYITMRYERANATGVDFMEMKMPGAKMIHNFGFSEEDILKLIHYTKLNFPLIREFAKEK